MAQVTTDRRRGINSSAAIKVACVAASTANLTLEAEQTVDGIALVDGDRCFVKDQTDTTENGIYVVNTGTWVRAVDFDGTIDVQEGTLIPVSRGTANADTEWRITNTGTIVIGTTALAFEARSLPGASSAISFLQTGTGAVLSDVQTKLEQSISVKDFGATGDGATDDTTTIQAAIDAAEAAGVALRWPAGTYITGALTIDSSLVMYGAGKWLTTLKASSPTGSLDLLTINNTNKVEVRDLGVDLDNTVNSFAAGYVASRNGIFISGTSNASYNTNFKITDVLIENCGEAGLKLQYADEIDVDVEVRRCGQYGIYALSVSNMRVHKPRIFDIYPGNSGSTPYLNAYGITFTNAGSDNVSVDCDVFAGKVEDVTSWEAYDTHAGKRIRFHNCSSKNCGQGIAVESTTAGSESEDVIILGGQHSSYGQAFSRSGQTYEPSEAIVANMGSTTTNGEGLIIKGVTSRGHGSGRNSSGGAIKAQDVEGAVITGNLLIDSLKRGIVIVNEGKNILIDDNVIDGVTSVGSVSRGIEFDPTQISGRIGSRNYITGTTDQTIYDDEITIATAIITVFMDFHHVDTQANASSDDLETITAGYHGQKVTLAAMDSARSVVVKDGTGNLRTAGDFTMDNTLDIITLIYDGTNAVWSEVCRSDNET